MPVCLRHYTGDDTHVVHFMLLKLRRINELTCVINNIINSFKTEEESEKGNVRNQNVYKEIFKAISNFPHISFQLWIFSKSMILVIDSFLVSIWKCLIIIVLRIKSLLKSI